MWRRALYCLKSGGNGLSKTDFLFGGSPIKSHSNLQDEFSRLWDVAEAIWTQHENDRSFGAYVSADYEAVLDGLIRLQPRANTFLEWGSGLGVVTIMAGLLGYDACGIEAELELVEYSRQLAEQFQSPVEFAAGGFIPDGFQWRPELGEEAVRTAIDLADAYDDLGRDLDEFDLVYGYPWPTEHELFKGIMRDCGGPHSSLLIYDAREGILIHDSSDWIG